MANTQVIKGVQYSRDDNGNLVPVFPVTTADAVYYDVDKKITLHEKIFGGKVSDDSNTYSYHNIFSASQSGPSTGAMKITLPVNKDNVDVDVELNVSGLSDEVYSDLNVYNVGPTFTRNSTEDTRYTTIREIDPTGRYIFAASYNSSDVGEYSMFVTNGPKLTKMDSIILDQETDGMPLEAKFDSTGTYLVILCENTIRVFKRVGANFVLLDSVNSRTALETSYGSMNVDHICIYNQPSNIYVFTTSDTVNKPMESYVLNTLTGELTLNDITWSGTSYDNSNEMLVGNGVIFIKRAHPTIENAYTIDSIYRTNSTSWTWAANINILSAYTVIAFDVGTEISRRYLVACDYSSTPARSTQTIVAVYTDKGVITTIRVNANGDDKLSLVNGVKIVKSAVNGTSYVIDYIIYGVGTTGASLSNGVNGIARYCTTNLTSIPYLSRFCYYNTNTHITEPYVDVLIHPNNGYLFAVTETNKYGTIFIAHTMTESTSSSLITSNPSSAYGYPYSTNGKAIMDNTGGYLYYKWAFNNVVTCHIRRSIGVNSFTYSPLYIDSSVGVYDTIYDVTSFHDRYVFITGRVTTQGSYNVVDMYRLDETRPVRIGRRTIETVVGAVPTKTYVSKPSLDGNTKGIFIVSYQTVSDSFVNYVYGFDFSSESASAGIAIQQTLSSALASTRATSPETAGSSARQLIVPATTRTNFVFPRQSITNGFFAINASGIQYYTVDTTTTPGAILIQKGALNTTDITGINIDDAVLTPDDKTLIFAASVVSQGYIKMLKLDTLAYPITLIPQTHTLGSEEFSVQPRRFCMDYVNNELILIDNGDIAKYSIRGDNNDLVRLTEYTGTPPLAATSTLFVSEDGSIMFGTTGGTQSTTTTDIIDFGTFFIDCNKSYNSLKIRIRGHLDSGGWTRYNITSDHVYPNDTIQLGYDSVSGLACILIGRFDSSWNDTLLNITHVSIGGVKNDTDYYMGGYGMSFITSNTGLTNLTHSEPDDGITYAVRYVTSTVMITPSVWTLTNDSNGYVYRYYNPKILPTSTVNVNVADLASLNVANVANVHSISKEFLGYVEIYSQHIPKDSIYVSFEIFN